MMTDMLVGRGHHYFEFWTQDLIRISKKIMTDSGGVLEKSKYLCDSIYELPQRAVSEKQIKKYEQFY